MQDGNGMNNDNGMQEDKRMQDGNGINSNRTQGGNGMKDPRAAGRPKAVGMLLSCRYGADFNTQYHNRQFLA